MAASQLHSVLLGGRTASLVLTTLTLLGTVSAVPSTNTLGDITILATDTLRRASDPIQLINSANSKSASDINGTSAALLLSTPRTYQDAEAACASLGESLWSGSKEPFTAGLNSSLSYEVYKGSIGSDQPLWTAQESHHPWKRNQPSWKHGWPQQCAAILPNGDSQRASCNEKLPALCTQSAPASSPSFADNSSTWQIEQSSGSQSLIGYRDFLTFQFRGVRFAEQPEAFTYSSVYNNATGTNYALANAPECLQPSGGSADCLFLNIWTTSLPAPGSSSLKPVMVYIYGGGFTTGSASSSTTDGGNLAARGDVMVINIAYRLGALGVLAFNDGIHKGNYWISDQIAGLQWVQEHAADFGGDPSQVTIFGESAGAESVQALVASPKARGLFRAAIIQSTYLDTYLPIPQFVAQFTNPIVAEAGCADASNQVACLQAYNATALTLLPNVASGTSQTITIDGTYLTTSLIDLNATATNKTTSPVPIMIGNNRDEAGVLLPNYFPTNVTASFYNLNPGEGIQSPPNSVIAAALASGAFPLGTGPTNNNTLQNQVFNATARFFTDYQLNCVSKYLAYTGAATGALPAVYYYEVNRTYQDPGYNGNGVCQAPVTSTHPYGDPELEYFKCHAGELEMNFGNFARDGLPERDEFDIPYAQRLTDYWTSFGRTMNPNPSPAFLAARGYWATLSQNEFAGTWEPVNASAPRMMSLQWNSAMLPFSDTEQCAVIGESLDSRLG